MGKEAEDHTDGPKDPTRRKLLQLGGLTVLNLLLKNDRALASTQTFFSHGLGVSPAEILPAPETKMMLSHAQFLDGIGELSNEKFLASFKNLMQDTAKGCLLDGGNWVIPSKAYGDYFFSRDSFWLLAALKNPRFSQEAVRKFQEDQTENPDGHIATALQVVTPRRREGDRDEESTLIYVLHNYLVAQMGGKVDKASLGRAYGFIASHVKDGRYVTTGEKRTGSDFDGVNQVGTYHYWADTFRPAGRSQATPEVISYNQGLYCVALNCLEKMGVSLDPKIRQQAEEVYAKLVNPEDGLSLPQREGTTIMDISALAPEALSLYFFDKPLLPNERVEATLTHLAKVYYPDGKLLGFKVISDYYGRYRPDKEFSGSPDNFPAGNYQNGGSWMLYDVLALYAASRHNVPGAKELFTQRLASEVRHSWASHEYLSTNPQTLGLSESYRDGYGWNTFVLNLLP